MFDLHRAFINNCHINEVIIIYFVIWKKFLNNTFSSFVKESILSNRCNSLSSSINVFTCDSEGDGLFNFFNFWLDRFKVSSSSSENTTIITILFENYRLTHLILIKSHTYVTVNKIFLYFVSLKIINNLFLGAHINTFDW